MHGRIDAELRVRQEQDEQVNRMPTFEQKLRATVKHRAKPRMRPGTTTNDYRNALTGNDDGFGSLSYEWSDKPHRLVYDLCGEIDALNAKIKRLSSKRKTSK